MRFKLSGHFNGIFKILFYRGIIEIEIKLLISGVDGLA